MDSMAARCTLDALELTRQAVENSSIPAETVIPSAKVTVSVDLLHKCMRGSVEWSIPVAMLNRLDFPCVHGA
jgi:hypothetical protein